MQVQTVTTPGPASQGLLMPGASAAGWHHREAGLLRSCSGTVGHPTDVGFMGNE